MEAAVFQREGVACQFALGGADAVLDSEVSTFFLHPFPIGLMDVFCASGPQTECEILPGMWEDHL